MASLQNKKDNYCDVKKRINFDCDERQERSDASKQYENKRYFIFSIVIVILLIFVAFFQFCTSDIGKHAVSQATLFLTSWHEVFQVKWDESLKSRLKVSEYLPSIIHAGGMGVAITLFSWIVTYYDSSLPGIQPPTPLSPRTIRVKSGHSFHMGYILALVNGILCSFMALLWL